MFRCFQRIQYTKFYEWCMLKIIGLFKFFAREEMKKLDKLLKPCKLENENLRALTSYLVLRFYLDNRDCEFKILIDSKDRYLLQVLYYGNLLELPIFVPEVGDILINVYSVPAETLNSTFGKLDFSSLEISLLDKVREESNV